ncbi:hypothetical protein ABFS83_06G036200 [Erythranthe nasuta]
MSFGGFTSKTSSGFFRPSSSGGGKTAAEGLSSFNPISAAAAGGGGGDMSQPLQMLHSSSHSRPFSLACPKMENIREMGLIGETYELESRSGSDNIEAGSGDDHNTSETKSSKRKKYHRHTTFQIQELESSFKDNPHPDEKARLELGKRLALEGKQVKFWFQNRRTQMKTQLERHENSILKQENEKLRIENMTMKEAMRNPTCETCGSQAILGEVPIEHHHLMIENARLKDELSRLGILASKFLTRSNNGSNLELAVGRNEFSGFNSMDNPSTMMPSLGLDFFSDRVSNSFPVMPPQMSVDAPFDKSVFLELALAATDELIKLAQVDSPLWVRNLEGNRESLNLEEYAKTFPPCIGVKPAHFVTEATRASENVMINSTELIETLMDVNQWTEMFPWNIGRASIVDVISPGISGSRNGALQLMQAEFQILSPLVPPRQVKFVRFCKQHKEDTWAVVDVSVDTLFQLPVNCRRLPSGCIVQDMPNGCSKVTWVEHTEYDESNIHQLYQPILRSGTAFGAQKWVADLRKQCELFSVMMSSVSDNSGLPPSSKKSMVKLAQRMTRNFCSVICSTVHKWEVVQSSENTRIMVRKSMGNSGEPSGIILSATTTVWMPVSPRHLLEFLQNVNNRAHWDGLSRDGPMQPMLCIPKSQDFGNTISLLRSTTMPAGNGMLILQETCSDESGSMIVHAGVEAAYMNAVVGGGDPSGVAILPSGFAIAPDCFPDSGEANEGRLGGGGGSESLLTVVFQMLVSNTPAAQLTIESVETVKSLIARTLQGIKNGLQ